MVDESPPQATQLEWDANAGAFVTSRPAAETVGPRFIKGPLPLPWIQRAAAVPGKGLHVALGLCYVSGLRRSKTFPFKRSVAAGLSVSPDALYDALTRLEQAGLISVTRHRGRSPVVTILAAPS